jgi:hypothetical protein
VGESEVRLLRWCVLQSPAHSQLAALHPACPPTQSTARLRYPTIKEPLSSVCVGAGALLRPLRGQVGAALLCDEVLTPGGWGSRLADVRQ